MGGGRECGQSWTRRGRRSWDDRAQPILAEGVPDPEAGTLLMPLPTCPFLLLRTVLWGRHQGFSRPGRLQGGREGRQRECGRASVSHTENRRAQGLSDVVPGLSGSGLPESLLEVRLLGQHPVQLNQKVWDGALKSAFWENHPSDSDAQSLTSFETENLKYLNSNDLWKWSRSSTRLRSPPCEDGWGERRRRCWLRSHLAFLWHPLGSSL